MHFNKKSKTLVSIITACLFILMAAGLAFAASASIKAGDQCTVNVKTGLNFRSGPGTNYGVFKSLPKGTALTVVEQCGNWLKVKGADEKIGFVMGKYLALSAVGSATTPVQAAPAQSAPAAPVAPAVVNNSSAPVELTISAAASLTDAMKEIQKQYAIDKPNVKLTFNFGSSGSLQQQIEQGAPADVFISAATKQMKALQDKKLIIDETNINLLKNRVVLVVAKTSDKIKGFDDLKNAKVIAIGEPASVPAGQYAKDVLTSIKTWDSLKDKMVYAKDVRQVLAYVESGNAEAGVVYSTDAKISDKVKVAATAEEWTHTPVIYPAAVIKSSKQADAAKDFLKYLSGDKAKAVFENFGFSTVSK